jgi:hypothetical protein
MVCLSIRHSADNFNEVRIMACSDELDEQAQQEWDSRFAKKREELSKSVEETLVDGTLAQELLTDELDESDEHIQGTNNSLVIPPRLSLQSKPIPVVHVEAKEAKKAAVVEACSTNDLVEVPPVAQKKQRLAGRTTKVRLQAVPKSEKKSGGKISIEADKNERGTAGGAQANVKSTTKRSSTHEADALIEGRVRSMARGALSGSGVFKRGQQEVKVANTYVSPTSVAVVTLVGDPGPVVVKYVSLQPQVGFTVHLSAPAEAKTAFNYVVLMGELF